MYTVLNAIDISPNRPSVSETRALLVTLAGLDGLPGAERAVELQQVEVSTHVGQDAADLELTSHGDRKGHENEK